MWSLFHGIFWGQRWDLSQGLFFSTNEYCLIATQTNDSPTTTISDAWAVYSELAEEAEGRLPVRVALTEEITEHFDPGSGHQFIIY